VKDLQQWAAVHELHKRKFNISQIAKQLGMSRNTVKKLLREKEVPRYLRTHYPSKMDAYMDNIIMWRTMPAYDYNGTRIYKELKALGYAGSINPLYRILKSIESNKNEISPKASVRIETPVGDQAQFDWSPYNIMVNGRFRVVYCFTMILAASRKKAICFSLTSDSEAIYESIQELFEELGGVTLELLIDNPKSLVIEHTPKTEGEIKYNPEALLIAAHVGTELNACNCYWPRTKGKIEKPYQYIEEQFIKGNTFSSMEDLDIRGKKFIKEWNNEIHGTTKRIPEEFFKNEEIKALRPIPMSRLWLKEASKRVVSNDSYVNINTNKYSVPVKYATKNVMFRIIYGFRIDIYTTTNELILTTEAKDGKFETITNHEHYKDIAVKASKSIPQIKRDFTSTFKNGEEYLKVAGYLFQQPSHHARKILELTELYQTEDLDKIIRYAIDHGSVDINSIKKLLRDRFFEIVTESKTKELSTKVSDEMGLTRNCGYYEKQQEVIRL